MRYSTETRDRTYVESYAFLSFAKNIGKSGSSKYSQKLLDSAKTSTTDAIKTASKRAIQKSAEVTGDLIRNKIADKITKVSSQNNLNTELNKEIQKERYMSPEKRQQIIGELKLI